MKNMILTIVLTFFINITFSQTADLTITFKEIADIKGNIEVGLYKNEKNFPDVGKDDISAIIPIKSREEKLKYGMQLKKALIL